MSGAPKGIEEGLGSFLRREREARGITLREVSDETRIRIYYLERIEEGDFSRLPAGPVARGFVRAYATGIGVDSDSAARQYDREVGHKLDREFDAVALSEKIAYSDPSPRRGGQRVMVPVVAVVFFILACGAFLWYIRGKTDRLVPVSGFAKRIKDAAVPAMKQLPKLLNAATSPNGITRKARPKEEGVLEAAAPAAAPSEKAPLRMTRAARTLAPALPEGENEAGSAPGGQPNKNKGNGEVPPPEGRVASRISVASAPGGEAPPAPVPVAEALTREGRLALKVLALEDTWLRVVVDTEESEELLLMAGNEKNWNGSEKFILTVGNVSGTEVSLNGTRIPLPRSSSNVVRDFVVTEKLLN